MADFEKADRLLVDEEAVEWFLGDDVRGILDIMCGAQG